MSIVHGISTVTKHGKWSDKKVKKGTGHAFYMATPSHATESVEHYELVVLEAEILREMCKGSVFAAFCSMPIR